MFSGLMCEVGPTETLLAGLKVTPDQEETLLRPPFPDIIDLTCF